MNWNILNAASRRFVWNRIWTADRYANVEERSRRAQARIGLFDLSDLKHIEILDLGCGSGELIGSLAREKGASRICVGVDRSIAALKRAQETNARRYIKYICADANCTPFASERFDAVFLFGLIEHVKDHQAVLAEVHRVMRSGGQIFLSSSNAASALQIMNRFLAALGRYPYGFQRNWTLKSLRRELERYFKIQRMFVSHADADMRNVRFIDRVLSRLFPRWGRYICFVATK